MNPPVDNRFAPPLTFCAANESRLKSGNFSRPLTDFAAGWRDAEDLAGFLDFLAPRVPAGRRFEFKAAVNIERFAADTDDSRALGAAFKRVEFTGSTVNAKTLNKGLTLRVDRDDQAGRNWAESYVALLINRLRRNEIRRAVTALAAAATLVPRTWAVFEEAAHPAPDNDLREHLGIAASESGVRPNRVLFGESAWNKRVDAYDLRGGVSGIRRARLSPAQLARSLPVDEARILLARWQSAAASKTLILGAEVLLFFAQDTEGKDDPSNIKRFVTPDADGNDFRVYLDEHDKFSDLTVEHYSAVAVTSALGLRRLTII